MKSISDFAKELNISPQAIYKKINHQLTTELVTHIHKGLNGKTLIDEVGEIIIKESLTQKFKFSDNQFKPSSQPFNSNFELVELLKKQLEVKDNQIGELLNQQESLIEKIENMQILLKSEQDKKILLPNPDENRMGLKTSFLKKIFFKKY